MSSPTFQGPNRSSIAPEHGAPLRRAVLGQVSHTTREGAAATWSPPEHGEQLRKPDYEPRRRAPRYEAPGTKLGDTNKRFQNKLIRLIAEHRIDPERSTFAHCDGIPIRAQVIASIGSPGVKLALDPQPALGRECREQAARHRRAPPRPRRQLATVAPVGVVHNRRPAGLEHPRYLPR